MFTKKEEIRIVRKLASLYNVRLILRNIKTCAGLYYPDLIVLSKNNKSLIQTMFHELGHHYCASNYIFPIFHSVAPRLEVTRKNVLGTCVKAERFADAWGEKECKKFYPELEWRKTYASKEDVDWLKKDIIKYFNKYYGK